ncbi:hypothetical protein GCM10023176_26050 [Micromonospora coerulea]|uniref:Uncharacterized protein n=1 Tax=Micromonospora coerulea TaxID=47856 RepID=A0ABP8SHK8_9ACTN
MHTGRARDRVFPVSARADLTLARCLPRQLRAQPSGEDQAVVLPELAATTKTNTIQRMPRIVKT